MTQTAKFVQDLAISHRVSPKSDKASFLANEFNKIEGVEGDETLELIADLMRVKAISSDEANKLTLAHVREKTAAAANEAGVADELGDEPIRTFG
jgi:hypothetical protein